MAEKNETLWRGTSPVERAGNRRERLMDACHAIVGDDGSLALSVRAVCRTANVSPRHFYEVFDDADQLLLAAYERTVGELQDAISVAVQQCDPAWRERPMRDRLRLVFDAATTHLEKHPGSGRLIFREALSNSVLRGRAATTLPAFVYPIRQLAFGDAEHEAPPPYGQLEATLLSGGLAAAFLEWLSGPQQFGRSELVEYCTLVCLAVLNAPLPPTEP